MAKYHMIVDAEVYKPGMEDGFDCEIGGCPGRGICLKCKHRDRPYIEDEECRYIFISDGDYIVTDPTGKRSVVKPEVFEVMYKPIKGF